MSALVRRWGSPASIVAGIAWIVVWFHQQSAHGATQVNEMVVVWGMTWMDSSRLLIPAMLFVLMGFACLAQRRAKPSRVGRAARTLTFVGFWLLIAATTLAFWGFPWGSYDITFEEATGLPGSNTAGAAQALMSLVLTAFVIPFSLDLVRGRVIKMWVGIVLIIGVFTTVYLSPVFVIPGLAWLVLGYAAWPRSEVTSVA